ncbi:MAG: hypothetical protein MZV63_01885 [Marinilabiliales bacterium]|nr:hypothetical protein [Marinilabiliales bacterium]
MFFSKPVKEAGEGNAVTDHHLPEIPDLSLILYGLEPCRGTLTSPVTLAPFGSCPV